MANTHTHTMSWQTMTLWQGRLRYKVVNGTLGIVFEEMDLHGKPYTEAKTLYVHTEASYRDI